MITETYLTKLQKQYSMDFPNELNQPPDSVAEFLDLTATRLLIGKDIAPLKEWIEKYQQRAPISDRPVAEFFRLTRLSAVEELFDEDGKSTARKALELMPVVEAQPLFETDAALVIQKALSLSMLLGDENKVRYWRKKRLTMPVHEGWETSSFEILYLSDESALQDDFETILTAGVRVSISVLNARAQDSIAPMLLALAAYCRRRDKRLADVLFGGIIELDKEVFLDSVPKIKIVKKNLRYRTTNGNAVLQIISSAEGIGILTTGNYEIAPFTTKLAPTLVKEFRRCERNPAISEALCNTSGSIECQLKLNSDVTMNNDQVLSLKRRMNVGYEWAVSLISDIKAGISLIMK